MPIYTEPDEKERVAALVSQASHLEIEPSRVAQFASYLVFAQTMGEVYDYLSDSAGPEQRERTKTALRRVRKATRAAVDGIERLQHVLQEFHSDLTWELRHAYEPLTKLDPIRSVLSEVTEAMQSWPSPPWDLKRYVYAFWRYKVPHYPTKWNDAYQLAKEWGLTQAKEVESFRRFVYEKTAHVIVGSRPAF